ncbi:MAG TPA: endonuclease/exonuclease/phosphatase family protein [Longimicrobiaceae bacterium]|nr:endonuclease/exonuclease/phosphatase family protein [Longimicrobiaceae bacterium]
MRRALLLAALPLWTAACAVPAAAPPPGPAPLRVLVYNVHAGKDAGGVDNLARVAETVRETGADLVLLQEVDRGTERSGRTDQLAELRRLTGMHGVFGKTLDYQGGGYGIALLSRWPVAEDTLIHLPVDPPQVRAGGSREPRGVLRARVDAPGGAVYVLNTHLDASREDVYRRQEVAALLRIAEGLRGGSARVLLGGDLNATPESAVIAEVRAAGWRDAWEACGSGEGFTYPAKAPVKRIDYLFLPAGAGCDSAAVVGAEVSDHRGVLLVLSGDT